MSPAVRQWFEGFERMSPEEQSEARAVFWSHRSPEEQSKARAAFQNHTVSPGQVSVLPQPKRRRGRPPKGRASMKPDDDTNATKPARPIRRVACRRPWLGVIVRPDVAGVPPGEEPEPKS